MLVPASRVLLTLSLCLSASLTVLGVGPQVAVASAAAIPYNDRRLHIMSYNSDVNQDRTRQAKAFHQSVKHLSKSETVKVDMIGRGIPWKPHLFFNKYSNNSTFFV